MPGQDDDLLARLNALKPSSVKLSGEADEASIEIETTKPFTVEDKLAERLKGLRSGGQSSSHGDAAYTDSADALTSRIRDDVAAEGGSSDRGINQGETDEPSLEELLAELGPDDQWKLDKHDSEAIESLLKEARSALPEENDGPDQQQIGNAPPGEIADQASRELHETTGKPDDQYDDDKKDEEEADEYVSRLLAELDLEKKYGPDEVENGEEKEDIGHDSNTVLPSTPSNVAQQPPSSEEPPSYEDSELESRFSRLGGLNLPSTPTAAPSSRAKATNDNNLTSLRKAQTKSTLKKYTDEDIESWCCICNEDGEVKCLGCDGDTYCQNCWSEGHGNGPGQEKGHRAVQYNRKGPAAAAA